MTLALICILACVGRYLAVDATITRPLWARYPSWLDAYFSCSACSGFLFAGGAGLYAALAHDWRLLFLSGWETVLACAFLGIFTTPLLTAIHTKALLYLASIGHPTAHRDLDE